MDVTVEKRSSFEGLELEWDVLKNKISKNYYDPSLELEVLKKIYEIIAGTVYKLEILIIKIDNVLVAILPFFILNNPCLSYYKNFDKEFDHLLLGEGIPTHFHPMIDLDYIDILENYFVSYISYEWSFDISNTKIKNFKDYDAISLSSLDDYLTTVDNKHKKEFNRLLRKNSDIETKISNKSINDERYKSLLGSYVEYRQSREEEDQSIFPEWMTEFTSSDVYLRENSVILEHAFKNEALHTLEFYLKDHLIAVNFAVRVGPTMTDYLTLRDMSPEYQNRSLGIYAILKNIEYSYNIGCINYDLGTPHFTKNFNYKQKFFNKKFKIPFISNVGDLLLYNYIKNDYDEYPILYNSKYINNKNENLHYLNKLGRNKLNKLKMMSEKCGLNSDILITEI